MSKFTPGPWVISKRKSGSIICIGKICADEYAGSAWIEASDADAELAADAPALLEALESLIHHTNLPAHDSDVINARALIAKHRGVS